ncbi:MAG: hypothetical protein A2Z50_01330 [Nitrospirae bacterium RBG_19FT_COMBO_42_15]|nr:MAG: hypothetical protein A2Z50_01330 [Nitrospirae bacterium RBG_19FT_COMBO_42_15]
MDKEFEHTLTQMALRLDEVNRLVIKSMSITEGKDDEDFKKLLCEFMVLKKNIKLNLMDTCTSVVEITDKKAQGIIRKISSKWVFEVDKIIRSLEVHTGKELNIDELGEKEIDDLGSDLFYSWFSHYEYVKGLYEIGSLIVGISVPSALKEFVSEARTCFAFQQYNAVYSLCRTILEVGIRDICKRKGIIKTNKDNVINIEEYQDNISQLINKISTGALRKKIKHIYYHKTSFLIHGHKTTTSKEAKEMLQETLEIVQNVYSYNGF